MTASLIICMATALLGIILSVSFAIAIRKTKDDDLQVIANYRESNNALKQCIRQKEHDIEDLVMSMGTILRSLDRFTKDGDFKYVEIISAIGELIRISWTDRYGQELKAFCPDGKGLTNDEYAAFREWFETFRKEDRSVGTLLMLVQHLMYEDMQKALTDTKLITYRTCRHTD